MRLIKSLFLSLPLFALAACGDIHLNLPDPQCGDSEVADRAPMPLGCFEHADCGEGFRCDTSEGYPYQGAPAYACMEDDPCCGQRSAGARIVWDGVCVPEPVEPAAYCESDLNCVGDQRCELVGRCGDEREERNFAGCYDELRCVDPMVGVVCNEDLDCEFDEACSLLENESWGYCVRRAPVGEGCEVMECGAGLTCQEYEVCEDWCDQSVEDPECCFIEASCVETTEPVVPESTECTDDSDCGVDEFCDYGADAPALCRPVPTDEDPCAEIPLAFCEQVEGCAVDYELTSCPDADPNVDCDMVVEVCVSGIDS